MGSSGVVHRLTTPIDSTAQHSMASKIFQFSFITYFIQVKVFLKMFFFLKR